MSIFHKFKHKVHHAADKAKHTVSHVEHKVEHEVDHAAEQARKEIEQVADLASRAFDQIKGKVDHLSDEVKRDIQHLADQVKNDINHVADQAKSGIEHVADEAKKEVVDLAGDVADDFRKAFGEIEHSFTSGAFQKAIVTCLHLLKEYPVYPSEFGIEVPGGITISFSDTEQKVGVLEKYAENPPHGRAQIMEFIDALIPTAIQVQETIEIELVVVSSSALEFGPNATFTGEQIETIIDHILDKAGVK